MAELPQHDAPIADEPAAPAGATTSLHTNSVAPSDSIPVKSAAACAAIGLSMLVACGSATSNADDDDDADADDDDNDDDDATSDEQSDCAEVSDCDDDDDEDSDDDDDDASDDGDSDTSSENDSDHSSDEDDSQTSDETDDELDDTPGFLHVNGKKVEVGEEGDRHLLGVLRHNLQLTGAKYGCGEAQCGACKVLIDGVAKPSCVVKVETCWGKRIVTVEGLADGNSLSPVQEAFLAEEAFQCGYCTPGMVIAATALLSENPEPSREDIATALERNLCRCGTYNRIIKATQRAGTLLRLRGLP
jgi:aerobic-type carbon monoxide dehydrogenase small subunit (CoxS/CutS family)